MRSKPVRCELVFKSIILYQPGCCSPSWSSCKVVTQFGLETDQNLRRMKIRTLSLSLAQFIMGHLITYLRLILQVPG